MAEQNQNAKKKIYTTTWFWAIIIIVIIAISSSNNKPQKVGQNDDNSKTSETTKTQTFKIGDHVKMGKSIITINDTEYSYGSQYLKPTDGNIWINLNITIENTDSSSQYVTTLGQMFLRDNENNSYQVAVTNKSIENPGFGLDGQIIAHSKRTGWVGFEVPKTVTAGIFQYNGSMFGGNEAIIYLYK